MKPLPSRSLLAAIDSSAAVDSSAVLRRVIASRRSVSTPRVVCLLLLLGLSACSKQEPSTQESSSGADSAPQQQVEVQGEAREELLKEGEPAPEFSATNHDGKPIALSALRGKYVIVYFYPKDGTPGCTTEAQGFAAQSQNLSEADAVVIGVSSDDSESHREFADEYGLPFLLVPDTERKLARAFGVGSFLKMSSRVTFLLDREGKVAKVYEKVKPSEHADEILRDIAALNP